MSYFLPTDFALSATAQHDFLPLNDAAALTALVALCAAREVWQPVLKLSGAPDAADLHRLVLEKKEVHLWSMVRRQDGVRVALCVITTLSADWHVGFHPLRTFQPAQHREAVAHLTDALFAHDPAVCDVWTALPLPEPAGADEVLTRLGFTEVPSGVDYGTQKTYGLFRQVWQAYRA